MIIVKNVYKRFRAQRGATPWVLRDINLIIPKGTNIALIGANGAGKSTLLRLIGGIDQPTRGHVERQCRVSWPIGLSGGVHNFLTGRQNAKFVARIHGCESDIPGHLRFIQDFADLGQAFDKPVQTYSSGMRSRLQFAMSLAFRFDIYITDEITATGDITFRRKAKEAFKSLSDKASIIMVSHGEATLREFCQAGILLRNGSAYWFDALDDALRAYKESIIK